MNSLTKLLLGNAAIALVAVLAIRHLVNRRVTGVPLIRKAVK